MNLPPFFRLFVYIFIVNKIIISLFLLLYVLVCVATQYHGNNSSHVRPIFTYIQTKRGGGVQGKLGVVAALVPAKHIRSYKLPHHENKNYETFLGNLQDAWSGRYIS